MKRRRLQGFSILERALIERSWHERSTQAHIHALIGDDSDEFVNNAGRVMFVVLGACVTEEVDEDLLEVRILRGGCNALIEQKGEPVITPERRASIRSGLEACERLIEALPRPALVASACDLELKLRRGYVMASDFEARLKAVARAT